MAAVANAYGPIYAWLKASAETYNILIKNLDDNKTDLLKKIESAQKTEFKDTPQTEVNYNESHNTTVTDITNTTDGATLMVRLNEIEDNLKRLYEDWSNEFRKFIIWSAN